MLTEILQEHGFKHNHESNGTHNQMANNIAKLVKGDAGICHTVLGIPLALYK